MDPHDVFCPDPACPATGQIGEGNINIHSRHPERYRCNVCKKTFGARKGTPFYRRRIPEATKFVLVMTLVAHGCPILRRSRPPSGSKGAPCRAGSMPPETTASKSISILFSISRAIWSTSKPMSCG